MIRIEKVGKSVIFTGFEIASLTNGGEKFVWVLSGHNVVLSVYDRHGNDAGQYKVNIKGMMGQMASLHQGARR